MKRRGTIGIGFCAAALTVVVTAAAAARASATQPATQPADGVVLSAAEAHLHGAVLKLTYAKQPEICYWTDPAASVEWELKVPHEGTYDVQLVTACEDGQGGKFVVSVGGQDLPAKSHATGGWHKYKVYSIGAAKLTAGDAKLTIRATGPINGSLMNLRAVRLVPKL